MNIDDTIDFKLIECITNEITIDEKIEQQLLLKILTVIHDNRVAKEYSKFELSRRIERVMREVLIDASDAN